MAVRAHPLHVRFYHRMQDVHTGVRGARFRIAPRWTRTEDGRTRASAARSIYHRMQDVHTGVRGACFRIAPRWTRAEDGRLYT